MISGVMGHSASAERFQKPSHIIRSAWRGHALLVLFIVAYAGLYVLLKVDDSPNVDFDLSRVAHVLGVVFPMFLFCVVVFLYARLMYVSRGRKPSTVLKGWIESTPWAELLAFRIPLAILFLVANQFFYVALKVNIPHVIPFTWDQTFAELDRWLFLGIDPWRITHALLPTAFLTAVVDALYVAWFFVVYLGFLVFAVLPLESERRLGFLLAFGLAWAIGGSLMATVFASAGPVYMEPLTGDPTFAPLMARLAEQAEAYPLVALGVQETLWLGYSDPEVAPVGISAFPSMHNCLVVVITLGMFSLSRFAGWLMVIFSATVLIGSVHLGWHYAVDSIVGMIFGWLCWKAGMDWARWWLGKDSAV